MADDLNELGSRLASAQTEHAQYKITDADTKDAENMNTGLRAGAELVSAIFAGGLIGWLLDHWLHTKPVFLIIMLLLGIITGFVNVWRITQATGSQVGYSELHRRAKDARTLPDKENDL